MLELMGKKIFKFYDENFCLSKPVIYSIICPHCMRVGTVAHSGTTCFELFLYGPCPHKTCIQGLQSIEAHPACSAVETS